MELDFDFDCPTCGRKIKTNAAEVARGATKHCPGGHTITLRDEGGGMRRAQGAIDDLERKLKNFGRQAATGRAITHRPRPAQDTRRHPPGSPKPLRTAPQHRADCRTEPLQWR